MEHRLDGKSTLITGAGSGIGKAIALRYAGEGADVAVNDIKAEAAEATAREVEALGRKSLVLVADVTSSEQVQQMVENYYATFPVLDVLVNNAGIGGPMAKVVSTREEDWDKVMAVNLRSVFLMCKYFAKRMQKREVPEGALRGKIINMSSQRGKRGRALFGAYSASKFGVVSLTQTLAAELGSYRIAVNCICPGVIKTPIYGVASVEDLATANEWEQPCFKHKPVGLPDDVAGVAFFLASDDSNYMTGQSLIVTGGRLFV
nr:SDR family oxidoreductase [Candidatus Sigynarchaeum springense]